MRKGSDNNLGGNEWSIGSRFQKPSQQQSSTPKNTQPPSFTQNQPPQYKNIPKMKGRNPFTTLKNLGESASEKDVVQEVNSCIISFNVQQYSISDFMTSTITMLDSRGFSNSEVLEFILSQTKTKEYFSGLDHNQTTLMINSLLQSIKSNSSYQNKDSCIRFMGHLLFEANDINEKSLQAIYTVISKLAFDQQTQTKEQQNQLITGGSGSSQSNSQKLQRLAINCLANMFLKPSQFLKSNAEVIYLKLKTVFEIQMRKINLNFKSKRFISTLTTVIRALQLAMNENQKLAINDNECVKLFLNFYKLLFLGSPFAEKMLNIKIEESKQKGKTTTIIKIDPEELKSDSGSFIIDTSDVSSSDGGGKYNKNSPSDQITSGGDPYQKIKNYAALCLQFLFKNNNKALFNYWYILFPQFFMMQQSDFTQYLTNFNDKRQDYYERIAAIIQREPTIFYLLRAKENNSKLKCTICFTISMMLENQMIQKWQGQLEKEQPQQQTAFVSMATILGQFMRFLHYQLIYMIDTETDNAMLIQLIKTAGTLLHITPYSKMNKGLASIIVERLLSLLQQPVTYLSESELNVKLQILNTLAIAFNISDIIPELSQEFFKDQKMITYLTSSDNKLHNMTHSVEVLTLLQRMAKNYPQKFLESYESHINGFFIKLLSSSDKKKVIGVLKIVEEWLKNYKPISMISEDGDEETKESYQHFTDNPFTNSSFKDLLNSIVNQYLNSHTQQQTDVLIATLSILSTLDSAQWKQVFSFSTTQKILEFIYKAQSPPLLKAAAIKHLGYMVYFDLNLFEEGFLNQVYRIIFDTANDTNLNVQIRNSWTLANLSFINRHILDDYIAQETLILSINFSLSNKEKVASNGLRSLGYFLQNYDVSKLQGKIFDQINKSTHQINKVCTQVFSQGQKKLNLPLVLHIIIDSLESKSPKIAWNSCVALANILENKTLTGKEIIFSKQSIVPLIRAIEKSNNFKIKIHAASTLMKFKNFEPYADKNLLQDIWLTLMNSLEQINKAIQTTNDIKYAQTLELNVLSLWAQLCRFELDPDQQQLYTITIKDFLHQHSLTLLQTITEYLRKALKIPEYSGMFDKDLLLEETEAIFQESEKLEDKLNYLQKVIQMVRNIIKENDEVQVSFGVFEGFNSLANTNVKEYRGLEVLKGQKTSFQPSFEHSSSTSDQEQQV